MLTAIAGEGVGRGKHSKIKSIRARPYGAPSPTRGRGDHPVKRTKGRSVREMSMFAPLGNIRVCSRFGHTRAGSSFCVRQGMRREICLLQMNDEGLPGKWPHAALRDLPRGTPLPASRALPGTICRATRMRTKREQTLIFTRLPRSDLVIAAIPARRPRVRRPAIHRVCGWKTCC